MFEIRIMEVLRPESRADAPTPIVRDVIWWGEASSDDDAKAKAWQLWDEKYGLDERPESVKVDVVRRSS
jgi:hypothetical protein